MFSKTFAMAIALSMALGCARIHEPASAPILVSLKGNSDCFTDVGQKFADYEKGRLSAQAVDSFWECLVGAVGDFQRITTGDGASGGYSPQALGFFIERHFLSNHPLGPALLNSVMQLKRVLLGGSAQAVLPGELNDLKAFLRVLKKLTLDLQPSATLVFQQESQASETQVAVATAQLQTALEPLGQWLEARGQAYAFQDLRQLVVSLENWSGASGDFVRTLNSVLPALDLLPSLKTVLLSGSSEQMEASTWVPFVRQLGRGLSFYCHVSYAFTSDLNSGLIRNSVPVAMDQLGAILQDAVRLRPAGEIELSEWDVLFAKLVGTGWLPSAFSGPALSQAWTWILQRPLGGAPGQGLTAKHLERLHQVSANWIELLQSVRDETPVTHHGVQDLFQNVRDASVPLEWDREGRLQFPLQGAKAWDREGQVRLVWPFVLLNWLKEAYVGTDVTYLLPAQVDVAVGEVLPVLQSFGWLTSTKLSIGRRLSREADLFTLASNGDQRLDLSEAVRYLVFVASAYRSAEIWFQITANVCPDQNAQCLRAAATQPGFEGILSPLPRLVANLKKQKPGFFANYFRQAEETILGHVVGTSFSTADVLQSWMLLQYVETFLRTYDSDQNDTIDLPEARVAYVIYGPTLTALLKPTGVPASDVFGFFTFLMKYGDTPFTMFGGQIYYNHWIWNPKEWAFTSDRRILMGILNQLSKL